MSVLSIAAYVMSGLLIVIVNKCIVRDSGLHAPALVSSMGALFTAMFTRFLVFISKVERTEVDLPPLEFALRRAFPVGVLTAASLCFGNMSYIYLDAGFIQMLKAGTPALLLFMLSVCKIEKISPLGASLALTMVCGSALATLQQPNINSVGLVIQAASQAAEVMQCTAVQFFLQKLGFNAFDAGYYLAPAVAMCCLLTSMAIEWPGIIQRQQVWLLCTQLHLLLASGTIGIVVNLSSLLVIKYTSSLLAKLLVIVRSSALVLFFIIRGEDFTWLQMVGYLVTITAFSGYSALKATEVEKEQDAEIRKMVSMEAEEAAPSSFLQKLSTVDLTSCFFWFALLIIVGCGYQAGVLSVIERSGGLFGHPYDLATLQVPPAPFISKEHDQGLGAPVSSSVKALWVDEEHFLLHASDSAQLVRREDSSYLSSAWLVTSNRFGTVQLRALYEKDQSRWLDCNFQLTLNSYEACDFWMTPQRYDAWGATEERHPQFILRHAGSYEGNNSVVQNQTRLMWGTDATPFRVSDWVPETCGFRPQPPAPVRYEEAANQITVTMSTHLAKYADSIKFRQVLTNVFKHLKEGEFYIKEFLIIDDWYDGRSEDLNGKQQGPTVDESRRENLAFFPGCVGLNASVAEERMPHNRCTFIYQSKEERGQARAVNILLDLMTTDFWLHIDMDTVFQQDFYVSRALQPIFEQQEKCEELAAPDTTTTTTTTTTSTQVLLEIPKTSRRWPMFFPEDKAAKGHKSHFYYKGEDFYVSHRRLSTAECQVVAGVRLERSQHGPTWGRMSKPYKVERYHVPEALHNDTYVGELLNVSATLDKDSPEWVDFQRAVRWPLFRWRSGLFNLTYVKSLEAPQTGTGHFADFGEDFRQSELEFALRWARAGASYASLMHGCWSTG